MNFKNPLLLIIVLAGLGVVIFGLMSLNSKDSSDSTSNGINSTQNEIETSPDSISPPTEPPPGGPDSTQPTPVAEPIVNPDIESPTTIIPDPTPTENETVSIEVEGDEFSFSPATIRVARGSTVELIFNNIGNAPHNYAIDELGILTKTIGGGKSDAVIFTAPDTPTTLSYTSYCTIPGHLEAGMEGTLIVE
jgi:plastocyanin